MCSGNLVVKEGCWFEYTNPMRCTEHVTIPTLLLQAAPADCDDGLNTEDIFCCVVCVVVLTNNDK